GITLSADGKKIVLTSEVYPACGADDACNQRMLDEDAKAKTKARIYTSLLYRHWNQFQTRRRQHVLAIDADGSNAVDLTPGTLEAPPFSLGGPEQYAISPDSSEVAITKNVDVDQAYSTNSDIYVVPITGGEAR